MVEDKIIATEGFSQDELEEKYLKTMPTLEEGQIVSGSIIQIASEYVFVDIGYKSEGKIPIEEFKEIPQVGDKVSVFLIKKEGKEGELVISKKKADEKAFWNNIEEIFEKRIPVGGKISHSIRGGFTVNLGFGITGFLPISKTDVNKINDEEKEKYIGLESFFILERLFSNKKTNIVVSRRDWLLSENKKKKEEFFAQTKIGDEIEGHVKSFSSFGAFIDLGGFDGLLHINDMSWSHVSSPKDVVQLDEELKLKVIRMEPENGRINLSLKHFQDDPWSSFEEKFKINDIVPGKVTKLANFGAFVEIGEGIEGLVHISELSWVKKVRHPKEVVSVGDKVEVKILDADVSQGKVSLGLKQVSPNPWDDLPQRYPVGMRLKRKVKNLSNFGAFFELEEGIDGLLHIDDLSWTKKYKHPSELLNVDDEVELMVIEIDRQSRKIKLGLKQISEDPWISLQKAYPKGSGIEGEIVNITEFGFFIKVQGDIEGFINKSNLFEPSSENLEEVEKKYKVGDKIRATVFEISPQRQKLVLSRKELLASQQREEISKYLHDDDDNTFTLGDFLKTKE